MVLIDRDEQNEQRSLPLEKVEDELDLAFKAIPRDGTVISSKVYLSLMAVYSADEIKKMYYK